MKILYNNFKQNYYQNGLKYYENYLFKKRRGIYGH